MKIICTKDEFAMLVRNCYYSSTSGGCLTCVFAYACNMDECDKDCADTMRRIEDICEIEVPNG